MLATFDYSLSWIFNKLRLCLQSVQRVQHLFKNSDAGRHFQYSSVDKLQVQEKKREFWKKTIFLKVHRQKWFDMHFLRNKITPCFSTQSLRGGSSTPAELHLLGAQDDAFDRKYWHEGWKSLAQFNFPKRSIEANVCSTQKRRSQAKFFGSNAGNSLLIFDVDLMNEDLQVLKHLSVCKEANFYILLRSHFSRSRPSTYSISAIMFQRFFYSQSMHTRTLFGNLFMCCITHERRARLQLHVWLPYCHTCYSCHIQLYVLQTF